MDPQRVFDVIQKARHYNLHPSGVECIEIVRHLNFNLGNAMKYLWRHEDKENSEQDIEKAIYYLKNELSLREDFDGTQVHRLPDPVRARLDLWLASEPNSWRRTAVEVISFQYTGNIRYALECIENRRIVS